MEEIELGGDAVTDIVVFGREAGRQASEYAKANGGTGPREKVNEKEEIDSTKEKGLFKDGVYDTEVKGHNGTLKVVGTIENGNLVKLEFPDNPETSTIFEGAERIITKEIFESQSTEGIDTVSGATVSSTAILDAVSNILEQAK